MGNQHQGGNKMTINEIEMDINYCISYKQISEIEKFLVQRLSLRGVEPSELKEQALFKQR